MLDFFEPLATSWGMNGSMARRMRTLQESRLKAVDHLSLLEH
jgi:hypothetical protein